MRSHSPLIVAASAVAICLSIGRTLAAEAVITAVHGEVTITAQGRSVSAARDTKLTLPLEIHTGADGTVDLTQQGATLHVGPSSALELPEPAPPAQTLDRIKQSSGYVLYNIKKRKGQPLAVETPYLVSVVKGTMFTIVVEDSAATVALMEGSLDISAPGVSEHVLLKPNQSIRHASGEPSLSVRSSAPVAAGPHNPLRTVPAVALPDAAQTQQMAQVTRDLGDVGAAVSTGRLLAASHQGSLQSGGSSSGGSSTPTGPGAGSSGANGSPGGPSNSPGSSANTGSAGSPGGPGNSSGSGGSSGSGSTPGSGGSPGSGGQGGGAGSPGSTPSVPLPPQGGNTTGNCNGKSNGTGSGNCYGHQNPPGKSR